MIGLNVRSSEKAELSVLSRGKERISGQACQPAPDLLKKRTQIQQTQLFLLASQGLKE
jgi:hypothetical protein